MSVTYSESFVTALIASFMARDAKIPIDNAGVARYLSMLGEEKTASAIEHQTRAMKAKAKTLVAGGDEAVTPPKATPRKRNAAKKQMEEESPTKKTKSGKKTTKKTPVKDEDAEEDKMAVKDELEDDDYNDGDAV